MNVMVGITRSKVIFVCACAVWKDESNYRVLHFPWTCLLVPRELWHLSALLLHSAQQFSVIIGSCLLQTSWCATHFCVKLLQRVHRETVPKEAIHLCWKQSDQLWSPAIQIPFSIPSGKRQNQEPPSRFYVTAQLSKSEFHGLLDLGGQLWAEQM